MATLLSYIYAKFFKKYIRGKAIKNCKIDSTSVVYSGTQIIDSKIGRYSYIGYDCDVNTTDIGNFCSIAPNVVIGSDQHPIEWVSTSPVFENVKNSGPEKRFAYHEIPMRKKTIIGSDVWIGRSAIIMGGVSIGVGCIVGAGAIVTKDLEPYGIYVGVPAKLLRYRFDKETIKQLLETKWWTLPDKELEKLADVITIPQTFISRLLADKKNSKLS